MKTAFVIVLSGLMINLVGQQPFSKSNTSNRSNKIDSFMSTLYQQGQFSGAVLVALQGHVIYKKGWGFANKQTHEPFTDTTACYIGSLSKQFTAMGIMILKERNKLEYNQSIRRFFPDLPACMEPVTIWNLLTHTSGLVLFNDFPDMNEQDVFNILLKQQALRFTPGEKFEYCNAGYTLLGMIIEKISGKTLNDFLTLNIFQPLHMKNTYVNQPSLRTRKRAVGYYLFGDEYNYDTFIGGAGSVVSSLNDLYKWSKSLYRPSIVKKQTLNDAFTMKIKSGNDTLYGEKGYGFGWFVCSKNGKAVVQHDGGFGGFRSYIERQPQQQNSIIFISNYRHSLTGQIRQALNNILENKSYEVPRISYANWIIAEAHRSGMDKAIETFRSIANSKDSGQYQFSENEFNSLGYYLLGKNRISDAIKFFTLNTEKYPSSANAFDSLGEAYMKAANKEQAIANYKKSLALNPGNDNARDMIKKLQLE